MSVLGHLEVLHYAKITLKRPDKFEKYYYGWFEGIIIVMDQDFSVVKATLATHTTKLENIESQLKSIDSSLKYNMTRLNKLEKIKHS